MSRRRWRGLTLIELMVTLAVLAILTSVVYPMYQNQVRKARRAEAKSALMSVGLAQERYYSVNGQYGTAAQLGDEYTEAINRMTDRDSDDTPDYYSISVALTDSNQRFTVTASASGPQTSDDDCATLVVNQFGQRSSTDDGGDASAKCW